MLLKDKLRWRSCAALLLVNLHPVLIIQLLLGGILPTFLTYYSGHKKKNNLNYCSEKERDIELLKEREEKTSNSWVIQLACFKRRAFGIYCSSGLNLQKSTMTVFTLCGLIFAAVFYLLHFPSHSGPIFHYDQFNSQ